MHHTPLFCFGSLMDADILTLVADMPLHELTIDRARALGYAQHEVAEESYPVLLAADDASCEGLLISGLTATAMQRIQFYEGEEYQLADIMVEVMAAGTSAGTTTSATGRDSAGPAVNRRACYYREAGVYTTLARSWSFSQWVANEKAAFLPRVADYMALFGTMTAAEADAHWINSAPDSMPDNTTDSTSKHAPEHGAQLQPLRDHG